MQSDFFKISEVAKLTSISRQTLIYYDREGILKPAYIDTNNYRYYSITQIHLLQIINLLKEFGTPLKTIKSYLDNRDKQELIELFDEIKKEMLERIHKTKNYIDVLDYKSSLLKQSMQITDYDEIRFEKRESIQVFCGNLLTEADQNGSGHFKNAHKLEQSLNELGLIGLGLDVIVKQEFITKDYNDQISYFCVNLNTDRTDLDTIIIPGGLYVVTYHKGSYHTSKKTYLKLIEFIEKNDLVIDGDSYERSVTNYLTEVNNDNYLLEIMIPVKISNSSALL